MQDIVLGLVGTIWTILWFIVYFCGNKKYEEEIEQLDSEEYYFKELYHIGYFILEIVSVDINSTHFQKRIGKLSGMYGKKKASFLVYSDAAAQLTFLTTFLPLGILLSVIAGDTAILLLVAALTIFLAVYIEYNKTNKITKRQEEITRDFPHILSQMALLVNAGMPLREVLETSAKGRDGILAVEMKNLTDDIKNGIPEYEALRSFADRCGTDEVRKLSTLIIQNIRKGSSELAQILLELSGQIWRDRVSHVKEQGEKASAKLLIPIMIIFIGILMMIMVPMMSGMM